MDEGASGEMMIPRFLVVLGSYDHTTKPLMRGLQERLVADFSADPLLVYLIEDVTCFDAHDKTGEMTLIVETYEPGHATVFIFSGATLIEACDTDYTELNEDLKRFMRSNYDIEIYRQRSLLSGMSFVGSISTGVLVIRDQELTRGGELVELSYLLFERVGIRHLMLFKRSGITLSSMVEEMLSIYGIQVVVFETADGLYESARKSVDSWLKAG